MTTQDRQAAAIDVEQALSQQKGISTFSFWLLFICGACMIIDGFDAQAMGYAAPALIADWGIDKSELGPVFGAGLLGMLVGAMILSIVSDRLGRRPVLIYSTFIFGVLMLATPHVHTINQLLVIRFVTGFFLGAVMPNAMSLVGEFSPERSRVTRMMLTSCGFTVGAALGGVISAALLPVWGWEAIFYFGGIVPLLIGVCMVIWLPESIQYLVIQRKAGTGASKTAQLARSMLKRVRPELEVTPDTQLIVKEKNSNKAPVTDLFRENRAVTTLLLWTISFMNLINLYFLSSWLPTLVKASGYEASTAVIVGTCLQVGGIIGTLMLGNLIERFGFVKVLGVNFLIACISVGLTGQVAASLPILIITVMIAGFTIVGGQPAVNSLAASYYPTSLRATGIGWSLGIGRVGSVIGPVVAGQLLALQWSTPSLFIAAAIPTLFSCIAVFALSITITTRAGITKSRLSPAPAE